MLRVGGRLQQAGLSYDNTHPLILSSKSHIVYLLVQFTHVLAMHAEPSTLMAILAHSFHIIGLKRLLRKISRECVKCQRAHARTTKQRMGVLPQARSRPARPFSSVGVDFAEPMKLKHGIRKPLISKCYIAVFICFVTRATHLELVADLTSQAFIATLDRFTARTGAPSEVFSDNGTNFVGAQGELQDPYKLMKDKARDRVINWAAAKGIQWHFSPGRAPHFGGLWEAAARSMKTLLKKVVGEHVLRWDEFLTMLATAEATLNSRPLAPVEFTSDDGIEPLTPGHFLVGGPLYALPSLPDVHSKITSLRHTKTHIRTLEEIESRLLESASMQDKMEKICTRHKNR